MPSIVRFAYYRRFRRNSQYERKQAHPEKEAGLLVLRLRGTKLGGLDFDRRAFGFDLGFEGGGVLGVQTFFDGLRSAVY